jgi:hypothetical protein
MQDAGRFDMLGRLAPSRWAPDLARALALLPLMVLRLAGVKQWSSRALRADRVQVTSKPAELYLVFGANLAAVPVFVLAFDVRVAQGQNFPRETLANYTIGPIPAGASYTLDLPRGSRRFDFGILLQTSATPEQFTPQPGSSTTFHYEYLELE